MFTSYRPWVPVFSLVTVFGCASPEGGETGITEGMESTGGTSTATGTTGTTDTPTGPGAPEFDPQHAADLMCSALLTCECADPLYPDQATCVTKALDAFAEAESVAAENGLVFDSTCITAMAAAYPSLNCNYPSEEVYCSLCSVVSGDRQLGEDCTAYAFGSDCAQGLTCEYPGRCAGRCGNVPEGGNCFSSFECNDGLKCADQVCKAPAGAGESCVDIPCGDGLLCGADGKCGSPAGDGESCANLCCGEGLYCFNDICQPQLAEGGHCNFTGTTSCGDRCAEGLQCDNDGSGQCVPFRKEGESCDWFGLECGDLLECENDVCVPYVYFCEDPYALPWLDL